VGIDPEETIRTQVRGSNRVWKKLHNELCNFMACRILRCLNGRVGRVGKCTEDLEGHGV
jgi:hypothetical protein